MGKVFRESVSGFTHMGGGILAIVGTVFLGIKSESLVQLLVYMVFGISMVMLFAASATYHLIAGPEWLIKHFRKFDHSAIYMLIAGTYTPIVVASFDNMIRNVYLIALWGAAIIGIILKLFFTGKFRMVSTILYIVMGWACIFVIVPLAREIGTGGMILLASGGIAYTIGGVMYAMKRPNFWKYFGFHEMFHVFVLLGALAMFFVVYFYI